MKSKLTLSIILFSLFFIYEKGNAQSPAWLWAKSAGGTSGDYGIDITTDVSGNVLVTGGFESYSITFGTTTLTNVGTYGDILLVKYNASGNVVWAKSAGGTSDDKAYGICTDANGNVLVTGSFASSSITFGTTTLTNVSGSDIFIVKYDASGNVLWAKSAGGTSVDYGFSISTDANGNVLVTGMFTSTSITFGTTTLTNLGISNIFVAKYNASGSVLWAKSAAGTSNNVGGRGISTDASGNVLVTGKFKSASIAFGTITLNNTGGEDFFIVKYDASGNVLWAKSAVGASDDYGAGISTDASGNVMATGSFDSFSITFGTTTLTNTSLSKADIFIVKYDPSGNVQWDQLAGGTFHDYGYSISTDASGNLLVTGSFASPAITFGTTTLTNAGSDDIFVVKYDGSGNVLWAKSAGGIFLDEVTAICTDASGNAVLTGYLESDSITFGTTTVTNAGPFDIFVAKLDNTTGIADVFTQPGISIFPNPSNGQFKITSSFNIDEIKITNLPGQIIYQTKPKQNNISLQLDEAGIYFIQITTNKQTITKKLIVCK
ncbi:MAG: T9SS type A sorting domain-containing protein [Bacteroidia bacterium]